METFMKVQVFWMLCVLKMLKLIVLYHRYGHTADLDKTTDALFNEQDQLISRLRSIF